VAPQGRLPAGVRWAFAIDCTGSQLGASLHWEESIAGFVAKLAPKTGQIAGAAHGVFGIAAAALDGAAAARLIAAQLGAEVRAADRDPNLPLPPDPECTPIAALWEVTGRGKSFVDLQNDVTTADVRLAAREGYEHVEHMKRYTTHSMGSDQGRTGGLAGSAVLAAALGKPVQAVGQSKPRPYSQPVPLAALAGGETGAHFKPKRRLPLARLARAPGASFVSLGLWLRPLVYSRQGGWDPVLAEARHVRNAVGITDVSTLGKIDVQGADAAQFLDFIYANAFSTLPIGRARYGIMLREDAMLLDDGTTIASGPQPFSRHDHDGECRGNPRTHGIPAAGALRSSRRAADRCQRSLGTVRGGRTACARGRGGGRRGPRTGQRGVPVHGGSACADRRRTRPDIPHFILGRTGL
jgi:hypothetical protein